MAVTVQQQPVARGEGTETRPVVSLSEGWLELSVLLQPWPTHRGRVCLVKLHGVPLGGGSPQTVCLQVDRSQFLQWCLQARDAARMMEE